MPFYVALPSSTIDWRISDGVREIPIEERSARRGDAHVAARRRRARSRPCGSTPRGSPAANSAFDVTPARLVTGLITERGVCPASEAGLTALFPNEEGDRVRVSSAPHIVGMENSAPSLTPEGQRAVTFLVLV